MPKKELSVSSEWIWSISKATIVNYVCPRLLYSLVTPNTAHFPAFFFSLVTLQLSSQMKWTDSVLHEFRGTKISLCNTHLIAKCSTFLMEKSALKDMPYDDMNCNDFQLRLLVS